MPVGTFASAVHIAAGPAADLMEPFNDYTTNSWAQSGSPTIVTGRTGTAAQLATTAAHVDYSIPSGIQSDTLTVGFAFRATVVTAVIRMIAQFYSDANVTFHGSLRHNGSDGALHLYRGGTVLHQTAGGIITANTWQYIEIQTKLADSPNGTTIVRVDGVEKINLTGLDTKNAGTKTVYDTLRLAMGVGSNTNQYDDLYLKMGAGATFLGDITI